MPFLPSNLRFVWRSLARNPVFTAAAIVSIALGIGANVAIFTLADQMLLRMLPVREPQRLVLVTWQGRFIGGTSRGLNDTFAYPAYRDLRDGNPGVFTGIAARYQDDVDVADRGPAERARVELVTGNYFETLGVPAVLGRTFTAADDKARDAEPYVVLSYDFWQRRFGGERSVLNRVIDVNGWPMTVVGVAARGFRGFETLSPADLFVPIAMKRAITPTWDDVERRNSIWLKVFARLKPGVTAAAAESAIQIPFRTALENDLRAVGRDQDFAKEYLKDKIRLQGASQGFGDLQAFFATPLKVLLAMVGTLLLIACVNTANLLLTRAATRQKEIAVRLSLGATRASLVRLIMTESLMLAAAGAFAGLLLSTWLAAFLVKLLPFSGIGTAISTTPDWRILGFTAAITLLTAILFGLVPALEASKPDLTSTLKNEAGTLTAGGRQAHMRRLLVVAQVTLSLLLLAGAGLFARSLYALLGADAGIRSESLLTFSIDPSLHKYSAQRSRQLFLALQNSLRQVPGASGASAASYPLLAMTAWENTIGVEGYRSRQGEDMQAGFNQVLPEFFSTMGAPLLSGREFNEQDTAGRPKVVIVNETFAKRFFPHESPLGRHVGFGGPPFTMQIVGVVKDLKGRDLKEKPWPWTYTPALQDEAPSAMSFYVRTSGDVRSLARGVRRAASRLDAALPLYAFKPLQEQIQETHFIERLLAMLSMAFGLLATLLASVGLYGVTSYAVTRRSQEIGIRVALGAAQQNILSLVMRETVLLTAAGIVVAIPAALALGRYVESQLYGVRANDPYVLSAAVLAVTVVSLLAGYIPARRATRLDPIRILRRE